MKFIYVFSEAERDTMLRAGYILIHANGKDGVYVFQNRQNLTFALPNIQYVASDVLTFGGFGR